MSLKTIPRVPGLGNNRLTRHTEEVSHVLNSLIFAGILVNDGLDGWTVDGGAIPGITSGSGGGGGDSGRILVPRVQQWLHGQGPPDPEDGAEGDFYFQTIGGLVWTKTVPFWPCPPRWQAIAKLPSQGPRGERGLPGARGLTGERGPAGADSLDATAWTDYTPAWTASSSAPAIGSGTIRGSYKQQGKTLFFRLQIIMAADTTFGSGSYSFGLPAGFTASSTAANGAQTVAVYGNDVGGGGFRVGTGFINLGGTVLQIGAGGGGLWSPTVPHTWGTSDEIRAQGAIEVD